MANFWTKNSGTNLITLQEGVTIAPIQLPLSQPSATVAVISGSLPLGIYLVGTELRGTPREVSRETISTFVIRATYNSEISDRTFKITVVGEDAPQWITPPDLLAAGNNNTYFILDSAPIDFQLEVIDTDTAAGQQLEYFIGSRGGVLPPGIKLTTDGRLVGIVDPILAIEKASASGYYDEVGYDQDLKTGYDWSIPSANGFDSFYYDTTIYDLSTPTKSPKKLNRYYQFTVSVSDGDTVSNRTFRLYVVGDDFLRSDNTIMQVGTGTFTADITHIRVPIWITPGDLGYRRANNYITLVLDIIDPNTLSGVVSYFLRSKNDDGSDSILPPGLSLDSTTGEVAGRAPYQPAVTREYKFTIAAQRIGYDVDSIQLLKYSIGETEIGSTQLKVNKFDEAYVQYVAGREFTYLGRTYKVSSIFTTVSSTYDVLNLDSALVDTIPNGASINLGTVSLAEEEIAVSDKTFVVRLLGEVDSTIQWNTPADLGNFSANYISTLAVNATTTVPNATMLYSLKSGTLPPGLTLALDGEIIGKVNSFGSVNKPGLTVFDSQLLTFDQKQTAFDRTYSFTITAQDQFGFSAIDRTFTIKLTDPDDKLYSNISMAPLMTVDKRKSFAEFINNSEIFPPSYLYRPNDSNFGLQTTIKMLAYPGIETKNVREYVAALAQNIKRKQYKIGQVKTAVAKTPGTNDIVYEVVYLEVIDPRDAAPKKKTAKKITIKNTDKVLINSSKYTSPDEIYDSQFAKLTITTRADGPVDYQFINQLPINTREPVFLKDKQITSSDILQPVSYEFRIDARSGYSYDVYFVPGISQSNKYRPDYANTITTDLTALTIDGLYDTTRYNSSLVHMRDNIRNLGETEKNFMPLWMRSSQEGTVSELGLINAIPLCYCKPGTAKIIANTISLNQVDFSIYNIDIDRVIIDSSEGMSEEQYIVFANYEYNT